MGNRGKSVQLLQNKSLPLLYNFLCFLKTPFSAGTISLKKAMEYYSEYIFI